MLEINQAGLSWLLMLQKRASFRDFDVMKVARFTAKGEKRLLADAGITAVSAKARFECLGALAATIDSCRSWYCP